MGSSKNFAKLIKPYGKRVEWVKFCPGRRLGLDVSGLMYRVRYGRDENSADYIKDFLQMAKQIINLGGMPVFVFDGPAEMGKKKALVSRKKARMDHLTKLAEDIADYQSGDTSPIEEILATLRDDTATVSERELTSRIIEIGKTVDHPAVQTKLKRIIQVYGVHYTTLMEVFDVCGIAHVQATGEADHLLAKLAASGNIDCVLSEDIDMVALGCPTVGRGFWTKDWRESKELTLYEREHILKHMGIDFKMLVDIAILCGTDYTDKDHLPKGIGPVKAHHYISHLGSIEELFKLYPGLQHPEFDWTYDRSVLMSGSTDPSDDELEYIYRGVDEADHPRVKAYLERVTSRGGKITYRASTIADLLASFKI